MISAHEITLGASGAKTKTSWSFTLQAGDLAIAYDQEIGPKLLLFMAGQSYGHSGSVSGHHYSSEKKKISEAGYAGEKQGFLSNLSLIENIRLPCRFHGRPIEDADREAEVMQLSRQYYHLRPHDVTLENLKRGLLARSVVMNPRLLLLDRPQYGFSYAHWPFLGDWIAGNMRDGRVVLLACEDACFLAFLLAHLCGETLTPLALDRQGRELAAVGSLMIYQLVPQRSLENDIGHS